MIVLSRWAITISVDPLKACFIVCVICSSVLCYHHAGVLGQEMVWGEKGEVERGVKRGRGKDVLQVDRGGGFVQQQQA